MYPDLTKPMTTVLIRRDSETDRHRRRNHVYERETDPLTEARACKGGHHR